MSAPRWCGVVLRSFDLGGNPGYGLMAPFPWATLLILRNALGRSERPGCLPVRLSPVPRAGQTKPNEAA
jgi:hypothetical protein